MSARRSADERAEGWARIHRVVRRIPRGRVATYGQVALQAGMPRAARQVGFALHALPVDSGVPWHRVVNAAGRISLREPAEASLLQRARLEAEGIAFEPDGSIELARFVWRPRGSGKPSGGSSKGGRSRASVKARREPGRGSQT